MVKYQVIEVKHKENCKYTLSCKGRETIFITVINEITIPPDRNVEYIFLIYDIKEIMTKTKTAIEEYIKRNNLRNYNIISWHVYFFSYKHKKNVYDATKKIIYFKNVNDEFVNFYNNVVEQVAFRFNLLYNPDDGITELIICDCGYSFTRILNDFIISENVESIIIDRYCFIFFLVFGSKQGFFLTNQINPAIEPFYKLMLNNKNQQTKNDLLLYSLLLRDET